MHSVFSPGGPIVRSFPYQPMADDSKGAWAMADGVWELPVSELILSVKAYAEDINDDYGLIRLRVTYDTKVKEVRRLIAEILGIPLSHITLTISAIDLRLQDRDTLREAGILLGCESTSRRRRSSRVWRPKDVLTRVGELFTTVAPRVSLAGDSFSRRERKSRVAFEGDLLLFTTRNALAEYLHGGKFHRRQRRLQACTRAFGFAALVALLSFLLHVLWTVPGYRAPLQSIGGDAPAEGSAAEDDDALSDSRAGRQLTGARDDAVEVGDCLRQLENLAPHEVIPEHCRSTITFVSSERTGVA